jgi:hypothetical protein
MSGPQGAFMPFRLKRGQAVAITAVLVVYFGVAFALSPDLQDRLKPLVQIALTPGQ